MTKTLAKIRRLSDRIYQNYEFAAAVIAIRQSGRRVSSLAQHAALDRIEENERLEAEMFELAQQATTNNGGT